LKNIFRPGLLALPSRKEMLTQMALRPSEMMELDACWEAWKEAAAAGEFLTPDERMAACLVELRECSEATKRVTNMVQAQLDEFGLRDDRKI
jgi:predicted transcriptional regulator